MTTDSKILGDILLADVTSGKSFAEAHAQAESMHQMLVVSKARVPSEIQQPYGVPKIEDEQLLALGFTFDGTVEGPWRNGTLPPGWTMKRTDHAMWSQILDEKGRERAMVFHKTQFFHEEAFWRFTGRYSYRIDRVGDSKDLPYEQMKTLPIRLELLDGGIPYYSGESQPPIDKNGGRDMTEVVRAQGQALLDESFPDWENPLAYWD